MSCGSHGLIIPVDRDVVMKKTRRGYSEGLTIHQQKGIHDLLEKLLPQDGIFKVPKVVKSFDSYKMERICTSRPLFLGDKDSCKCYHHDLISDVIAELVPLWELIWEHGYAAWDFELFVQPDNRVAIIDFDRFGVRPIKEYTQPYLDEYKFFQHACFPPQFQSMLRPEFRTQGWLSR